MARRWVRYRNSGRLINGATWQGLKTYDAYTGAPTYEDRLEPDDYGELVDQPKCNSYEYDPKLR